MSGHYIAVKPGDITHKQPIQGPGMAMHWRYVICGHTTGRKGASFMGAIPMRCPACTKERKAQQ